jgi:CRISPR-associated endonuclease Csy4
MNFYINIAVLPDPEFPETILMSALFSKLHRALVEEGSRRIGVSFPKAEKTLGAHIRLHAEEQHLKNLMALNWLKGLKDYTEVYPLREIPSNCKHRIVSRIQPKTNLERLYRRSIANGKLSIEDAAKKSTNKKAVVSHHPFVHIKSLSTGQKFCLYIKQGNLIDEPISGVFTMYGLSSTATIPWF